MRSQSRQANRSRTVWITFQRRGITSSVSLAIVLEPMAPNGSPSSPSLTIRPEPQAMQAQGASITTRSRGKWAGNGLRPGWRRVGDGGADRARAAALSAASSSSVAAASISSSCSSSWSSSRALRSERCP